MRPESQIDKLANEFVKTLAKNYPSFATSIGFPGGERDLDDHSPEALERDYQLAKETIAQLKALPVQDAVDEVTVDAMLQSLGAEIAMHESGLGYRNRTTSPPQRRMLETFLTSPRPARPKTGKTSLTDSEKSLSHCAVMPEPSPLALSPVMHQPSARLKRR